MAVIPIEPISIMVAYLRKILIGIFVKKYIAQRPPTRPRTVWLSIVE